MSSAVKLSSDLIESARREGKVRQRSMTQQIEHWTRIGRLVERMGGMEPERLRALMAAELPFDELTGPERAALMADLERDLLDPGGSPELAKALRASGRRLSTFRDGQVVRDDAHDADPTR